MTQITVFGATGRVGSRVVDQAVARGWTVIASSHEDSEDGRAMVKARKADVLNDDLGPLIEGSDAVISCLGVGNDPATLLDPPPLYTDGVDRIITAMQAVGTDRLIVISATFVETTDRGPVSFRATLPALAKVFSEMQEMEGRLKARKDLRWTAVRPGWILEGDPSTDARVTDRTIDPDLIRSRTGDIAWLMLECVAKQSWVHGYPAIAAPESETETSLAAVAEEII